FPLLGIEPILGHTFRPEDDRVGGAPVALISEALWKRKFSSSPNILGRGLTLNGTVYTVVGVTPGRLPIFDPFPMDAFVPLGQWNNAVFRDRRVMMGTSVVGRLKPEVTLAQAQADMDLDARALAAAYPDADKGSGI